MNKIRIEEDKIVLKNLTPKIDVIFEPKDASFGVNKIIVKIKKNASLVIEYKGISESKLDIVFDVLENVHANIVEFRKGKVNKVRYLINLDKNSNLNISKFYDIDKIREVLNVNLNGENAIFNYNFKTISTNIEKYDMAIYHNDYNTQSNVNNNGINIKDGSLFFNVLGLVNKNKTNCTLNQNNRIINYTNNLCQINPNLYVDEYEINANHSAYIGNFKDEELFYLMRLGIPYKEALKLLINGFLLKDIDKKLSTKIKSSINRYWR